MQKAIYHSTEILHLAGIIPQVIQLRHTFVLGKWVALHYSHYSQLTEYIATILN